MTLRKMLSMIAVVGGVAAICVPSASAASPQLQVLPGTGKASSWSDRAFTAKDTRTLIWRVSRAGHDKQHMNLEWALLNQGGIQIKGRPCGRDDAWLTFSESLKTHLLGGKRCGGKSSFQRKPGYTAKRYTSLLSFLADQMFDETGIDDRNVGWPHLIKSDGRVALFIFGSPSGELAKGAIRSIRITGKRISIQRF